MSQHSKTITLESGGTVTVSGDFDLFTVSNYDREFIDGLADYLRQYGQPLPGIE